MKSFEVDNAESNVKFLLLVKEKIEERKKSIHCKLGKEIQLKKLKKKELT